MKALVTVGAGYYGSNITKKLIENGYEVTVLDNLSSGDIINIDNLLLLVCPAKVCFGHNRNTTM